MRSLYHIKMFAYSIKRIMSLSLIDKLSYFIKNQYHMYNNAYYPYKKVLIDDWIHEKHNKNDMAIMNHIVTGTEIGEVQFPRKKKATVYFKT